VTDVDPIPGLEPDELHDRHADRDELTLEELAAAEVLSRIHNRRVDIAQESEPADHADEARAVIAAVRSYIEADAYVAVGGHIALLEAKSRRAEDGPILERVAYTQGIADAHALVIAADTKRRAELAAARAPEDHPIEPDPNAPF
jgi:hypothetical protein